MTMREVTKAWSNTSPRFSIPITDHEEEEHGGIASNDHTAELDGYACTGERSVSYSCHSQVVIRPKVLIASILFSLGI